MPTTLARRLDAVVPSATLAINARARALQAQGFDVVSFGAGEPDFDTPDYIRDAAKRAIDAGKTRYTAVAGIPELRKAIAETASVSRGINVTPDMVVVSVGAKSALLNFALATLEPGDEVVIPSPYWVSYPEQARLASATPVFVPSTLASGWKMTPEALRAALTSRTKAVILCSPCNPTGAAYTGEQLRAFGEVLRDADCWVITDEIYRHLVYDGFEQRSIATVAPWLRDRTVIIDGVSKTYAMTGWRIGWSIAPKELSTAMDTLQGQGTSSPTTVAQYAALEALSTPPSELARMVETLGERRRRLVEGLRRIDGVRCTMPEGAFYAFVDVSAWVGLRDGDRVLSDDAVIATWLLEKALVAVVPGGAFGAPGHVRLSYAVSLADIDKALDRIATARARLQSA